MADLTLSEIVAHGLALVSRTDLTALAKTDLKAWLRSRAEDWPWPILKDRETGISLAQGTTALSFGAGSGGVSEKVARILDPIWIYDSAYRTRQKVRVRQLIDGNVADDETINDPDVNIGTPVRCKVRKVRATPGLLSLVFTPIPDRNLLAAVDYIVNPDDPGDSDAPWYENDRTMFQAVKCFALDYAHRYDVLEGEREILAAMVREDRTKYGQIDGDGDTLPLDSRIFR